MTLTERILERLKVEKSCLADVVRLLIDVKKSKHFLEEGFSSMLNYCTEGLGLSRSSALKRINAARVSMRFPEILERLEKREIHLEALMMLSRHLTEENHKELFEDAKNSSEEKLERLLATRFPSLKKHRNHVEWLSETEVQLSFVISAEDMELLERVKKLRKHVHPDGNLTLIFGDVVKDYLRRHDPMQRATSREQKPQTPAVHPRKIRRRIQNEIWKRDKGQCTFTAHNGHRCTETGGLEIDHRQAWADGGSSLDSSNLRLLCFAHNRYLGEKRFGPRPSH